jgi:DNA primase
VAPYPGHRQPGAAPRGELPKSFIDEVLSRTDIEPLVGAHVQLRKQGGNLVGLCPFHSEKSPSFTVSPSKQFFHCFGCGKNGDAINFLQEHAGLTFREAVMELAESAHVRLPDGAQALAPSPDLAPMYRVNETAAAFFKHCLAHDAGAKKYLRGRGLTSASVERFVIGFAPADWNGLAEAFPDYGASKALAQTGLVIVKDDGGRRYDRFRSRVMFGIRDARGRMLGFGGRTMDGSDPKYLNSSASAIFDKSVSLFGLFEAREGIRQSGRVLVVEGYMDCVGLSMAGIPNTVATMGTACTQQHVERLVALAPEIVFAFDGDAAGLKAAWRSLQICLPFASDERSFRFLLMPDGKDPDELVLEEGAPAFLARADGALTLSEFLIAHLSTKNNDLKTAEDRAKFSAEAPEYTYRLPPGRLARMIRAEVLSAAQLSPQSARVLAQPARPALRNTASPWAALATAAAHQPATAARSASGAVDALPEGMRDHFRASRWDAFPEIQRPFWQALKSATDAQEHGADQPTVTAVAQRDLLTNAGTVIRADLDRQARARRQRDYRAGTLSEEALIESLRSPATPVPGG